MTEGWRDADTGRWERRACLVPLTRFDHPVPTTTAKDAAGSVVRAFEPAPTPRSAVGSRSFGLAAEWSGRTPWISLCSAPASPPEAPHRARHCSPRLTQLRATPGHGRRSSSPSARREAPGRRTSASTSAMRSGEPPPRPPPRLRPPRRGRAPRPAVGLRPPVRRRQRRSSSKSRSRATTPRASPRSISRCRRRIGRSTLRTASHRSGGCSPSWTRAPVDRTSSSVPQWRSASSWPHVAYRSGAAGRHRGRCPECRRVTRPRTVNDVDPVANRSKSTSFRPLGSTTTPGRAACSTTGECFRAAGSAGRP